MNTSGQRARAKMTLGFTESKPFIFMDEPQQYKDLSRSYSSMTTFIDKNVKCICFLNSLSMA